MANTGEPYIFEEYYLTLPLDFLCARFLSTLYHEWIYEYWNSVFKETN